MTLTISQLIEKLQRRMDKHGDVPVALWDLDTTMYYSLSDDNIETQQMGDGSLRLSIGVNNYEDPGEEEPKKRPL